MLIFILPTSYPNEANPVANSFVEEQALALAQIPGNEVIVLNLQKQPSSRFFSSVEGAIGEKVQKGLKVIYKKKKTLLEKHLKLLNQGAFNRGMKALYRYAVEKYGRPDVIYAHFYSAGYAALKIEKQVPVVVLEHSGELMHKRLDLRSRFYLKKVVSRCAAYLATTDRLKENIRRHTKTEKPIRVLPNIIGEQFCYCEREERGQFTFFSLARLEYDKRMDLLIDAFCRAREGRPELRLHIGGDGKEYGALEKQIREKGCREAVRLLGRLDRQQVLEQMKACAAFVLPSRHETFGMVWREALCVGRPVITTDHGGFGETDWSSSYGLMVAVDAQEELAEAIGRLYEGYEGYDLQKISAENRQRYAAASVMEALMQIFEDSIRKQEGSRL